jgi:pyrroloquinoline quinone biosynthesis protein B
MLIRVLGSAAGGGAPQWNCGCVNCRAMRDGTPGFRARTQESVAVSADGSSWFLLNASPEIRQQIESFSGLHPRSMRGTPIAGIALTSGDLDHCLGLLSLRESQPLALHATGRVREGFTSENVLYRTLERFPGQVTWHDLVLGQQRPLAAGLSVLALPVPGKGPLHLAHLPAHAEDNVGLRIRDAAMGQTLAYIPGVARFSREVAELVAGADFVFFDGTFWSSEELVALGAGTRRAEDMAHWPVGGTSGSLSFLRGLAGRRVLIHINNTNPLLCESSAEAAEVRAAGVEIAYDGMELGT